jgi:hypothetical protein
MFEWQKAANDGLLLLVEKNRHYVDENVQRLRAMHQTYLQKSAHLYKPETRWINHYLDSVISVVHETLVVDCQIHHCPLDLAIQREQIVIY